MLLYIYIRKLLVVSEILCLNVFAPKTGTSADCCAPVVSKFVLIVINKNCIPCLLIKVKEVGMLLIEIRMSEL